MRIRATNEGSVRSGDEGGVGVGIGVMGIGGDRGKASGMGIAARMPIRVAGMGIGVMMAEMGE